MKFLDDVFYTADHEWIKFEQEYAIVGITDFAQKELGDIVYVEIGTLGNSVNQNDVFGTVEAVKTVSDLFLPVSGKIIEVNPLINTNPELVNTDPFGDGWMIKIFPDPIYDKTKLLSVVQYKQLLGVNN